MTKLNNHEFTIFKDVNDVLSSFIVGAVSIFPEKISGIYLTGSLSYGDFSPESSDIDFVVTLKMSATKKEIEYLNKFHIDIENSYKKWAKRIECSYIPVNMLNETLPPKIPRPYFGEGVFYPQALYGNEWIINQYLLYNHGISLVGPAFNTLINPVDILDVQKACIQDLIQEWEPKITDNNYLQNSHYQSYVVLNLCRILYTVIFGATASKKISAAWVKNKFSPQWSHLIQTAENWSYGKTMNNQEETINFIKFVVNEVKFCSFGESKNV